MNMKLSIVVPVYNVADYLEKCVDSLLGQRGRFEIVLVDDGSTDGKCGAICDRYGAAHPDRIRVIHQENGGLGAARNTGLAHAQGEYVLFVDSDDWLLPGAVETLMAAVDRTPVDMVIFDFKYVVDGEFRPSEPRRTPVTDKPVTLAEARTLLLDPPMAWLRLYRRDLFTASGVRFPSRVWYEDLRTTHKLFLHAKSILLLDLPLYAYLIREGSIMRSSNLRRNLEILDALEDVRTYYVQQGAFETYRPELELLAADTLLEASRRVLLADPEADYLPDFMAWLRRTFPDYRKNPLLPTLGRKKRFVLRQLERGRYKFLHRIFHALRRLRGGKT